MSTLELVLILAGLPAGLGVLLWAVIDLERFVLFVVLGTAIYPATLTKVDGANIALVDVALVIALVAWLINNAVGNAPDPWLRRNPLLYAGIAFSGIQWVSLIWTVDVGKTVSFGFQSIELFVLFPLLFASIPRHVDRMRQGMNVFLLLSAGMALVLIAVFLASAHARSNGTYLPGLDKNAAGSFQAVGVVFAAALAMRPGLRSRWPFAVLLIDIGGLAATESRGALLGAVAGVLLVSIALKRGRLTLVLVAMMLGATYFGIIAPSIATKAHGAGSYNSATARITIWKDAIHKIEAKPLLGSGAGTYDDVPTGQTDPNNTILLTYAEDGLPGLIVLVALVACFGLVARRAIRLGSGDGALVALAATGAVVALLVHFEVDVSWARGAASMMFEMMGLTAGLWRLAARDRSADRSPPDAPTRLPAAVGGREPVHV